MIFFIDVPAALSQVTGVKNKRRKGKNSTNSKVAVQTSRKSLNQKTTQQETCNRTPPPGFCSKCLRLTKLDDSWPESEEVILKDKTFQIRKKNERERERR